MTSRKLKRLLRLSKRDRVEDGGFVADEDEVEAIDEPEYSAVRFIWNSRRRC